jgi:hypothetical protein
MRSLPYVQNMGNTEKLLEKYPPLSTYLTLEVAIAEILITFFNNHFCSIH